jgi:chemotaxis protein CheX
MYPSREDIFSIACNVLDTMIHIEAAPSQDSLQTGTAGDITGCIQISGAWKGAVILQSTEQFARHAAAQMFSVAEEDVTAADMQDVMAEITNMIGGNIKSQIPSPSYLSLPRVTNGDDLSLDLTCSKDINNVSVDVQSQPLHIVLREAIE